MRLVPILLAVVTLSLSAEAAKPSRHPERLKVGDRAPEFALRDPAGGRTVRLSDFGGKKAVVLIFGSYTCPPFRDVYPTLEKLHDQYRDRVAFFYVYIREAHAEDGAKLPRNRREGVMINAPKSMEQRAEVAQQACAFFKTKIPALVDTMDDATDRDYAAWPSRIYVVDTAGRIAVQAAPGPRGLVPGAEAAAGWLGEHFGGKVQ